VNPVRQLRKKLRHLFWKLSTRHTNPRARPLIVLRDNRRMEKGRMYSRLEAV